MSAAQEAQHEDTMVSLIGTTIILFFIYVSYGLSFWILFENKKQDQFFLLQSLHARNSLYGHLVSNHRYAISIYTGTATYGSVRLKLIGSSNESTLQYLQKSDGMCTLKRDSISLFLLSAQHDLGDVREIQFRRTGTAENKESWFFKRILVHDLEKNVCWCFEGKVTFDILETDTWIHPFSKKQVEQASFRLRWENMFKDRHSLFALTPLTNWHHRALTRLERVSVFYLSVFMIMITTLGISGEKGQTLYSGFASPFIVAPVTHCIMEIFRLAQRSNMPKFPKNPNKKSVKRKRKKPKVPKSGATNPKGDASKTQGKNDKMKAGSGRSQSNSSSRPQSTSATISRFSHNAHLMMVPPSGPPENDHPPSPHVVTWSGPLPCGQNDEDHFEYGGAKTPIDRAETETPEQKPKEDDTPTPSPPPHGTISDMRKPREPRRTSNHQRVFPPPAIVEATVKVMNDPNSNIVRPLPGFFRVIARFLIVATIVTSTVICILQASTKDFTSTWRWWAHSLLAIVISVFVLEPMKIFLITLISYKRHPTLQISEWLPPIPRSANIVSQSSDHSAANSVQMRESRKSARRNRASSTRGEKRGSRISRVVKKVSRRRSGSRVSATPATKSSVEGKKIHVASQSTPADSTSVPEPQPSTSG